MCRFYYATYDSCSHGDGQLLLCIGYFKGRYPNCARPFLYDELEGVCDKCEGYPQGPPEKRPWDDAIEGAIEQQVEREGEKSVMEAWMSIKRKKNEARADEEAKRLWRMYGGENGMEEQWQTGVRSWTKGTGTETEIEEGEILSDKDEKMTDVEEQ